MRRRPGRHKIEVLQPVDEYTTRADDNITYDLDNIKYIYGSIEPLAGRELMVARQVRADLTHKITMRAMDGISHRTKFRWWTGKMTADVVPVRVYREFNIGPAVDDQLQGATLSYYAVEIL